jgi:tetratricopeptide (TPR) repeat protein
MRSKVLLGRLALGLALVGMVVGCGPKRLVDLAQKKDDRTEDQVRADRFLKEGKKLFDQGKNVEAQQKYLDCLNAYPMVSEAHTGLGDIYELEGDMQSALAEYIAQTEATSSTKLYMDRMLPYVWGKFSRNPASPADISQDEQSIAMVDLSLAIDLHRKGKVQSALDRLEIVRKAIPRAGLVDYLGGWWHLKAREKAKALEAFAKAAEHNGYFARRLLSEGAPAQLPGLVQKLGEVLTSELKVHSSDSDSAIVLAAIHLRQNDPEAAVKVTRDALAWGKPRWDLLTIKGAAHARLGQKFPMQQALSDLKVLQADPSDAFSSFEPSIFKGLLGQGEFDFAREHMVGSLKEPVRSYFLWRLLAEANNEGADAARKVFEAQIQSFFPPAEFTDLTGTEEPTQVPASLGEFLGAVQTRISDAMPGLWKCDLTRRKKRRSPSGRVTLRVEIGREGGVAHVAVVDNNTEDPVLGYCMVRKLMPMRFPKTLRATEVFRLPVMIGPGIDGLLEKAMQAEKEKSAPKPMGEPAPRIKTN